MPRFFVLRDYITPEEILINTEDVSHITKVLRLGAGDTIEVCDGMGLDYTARISEIQQNSIRCDIVEKRVSDTEPNIEVTLFQAVPKASKMEYIIQKTTELGISRIVPCSMERCVAKMDGKETKKIDRWRKIAEAAAKQSGRGKLIEITEIMDFRDAVQKLTQNDIFFAPYECEQQRTLKQILTEQNSALTVGFMIGPEGGYALDEVEYLQTNHVPTVTLGPRILRTETAGEAVLAMVMYEIGDIGGIDR